MPDERGGDRVIVALDVKTEAAARAVVESLGDACRAYKIGLELLTAQGPGLARELVLAGKSVFLDLKLFEIPASVAGAVEAAGELGAAMVSVHASAGSKILRAAVDAARPFAGLRVLALTVVTSMDETDLAEVGVDASVETHAVRLGRIAAEAGCHGVIASPLEAASLTSVFPPGALVVTPGTRLSDERAVDHVRFATPEGAMRSGATHVVVGRAIIGAESPCAAFDRYRRSVALGMQR